MQFDEQESMRRNIHNRFVLYVSEYGTTAITSDISIEILNVLDEIDLTASDISKKLGMPLSTVNNHVNVLIGYGLIVTTDVGSKDLRKRYLHSVCKPYLDNLVEVKNKEEYAEKARLTMANVIDDPEKAMMYSHALGFNFGLAVGLNYEHIMRFKGWKTFNALEPLMDTSLRIEEYIDKIAQELVKTYYITDITVSSYNPLTIVVRYGMPIPEYPVEILKYAIESFSVKTFEKYFGRRVSLSSDKVNIDTDGKASQELSFFI